MCRFFWSIKPMKPDYKKLWEEAKIFANTPQQHDELNRIIKLANKIKIEFYPKYEKVKKETGAPEWFIAGLHYRESDFNFNTYLCNGDSLGKKTTNVPSGIGPFYEWEPAAIFSIKLEKFNDDWSFGECLKKSMLFNGRGYDNRGIPSPYCVASTTAQLPGLFVKDGVFDKNKWDNRLGCFVIWKILGADNVETN